MRERLARVQRNSRQRRAMREAWCELEDRGKDVKAVRISAVGDVFLLTESQAEDLAFSDSDWVSLAGEKALPRA